MGLIQSHDSLKAESFLLLVAEREVRKIPRSENLLLCPYWLGEGGTVGGEGGSLGIRERFLAVSGQPWSHKPQN